MVQVKPPAQGSFGIPPEVHAAAQKAKEDAEAKRAKTETAESAEEVPFADDFGFEPAKAPETVKGPVEESTSATKILTDTADPIAALKKLGIDLGEEDFHRILFRGELEKDVEIFPKRGNRPGMTVTLKTLTTEEYDVADEILASEIRDLPVTNEGYANRKAIGVLAFGVTKLMGRPVPAQAPMSGDTIDYKTLANMRRAELKKMAPSVVSKLIKLHTGLTMAINMIVDDPKDEFLKKL